MVVVGGNDSDYDNDAFASFDNNIDDVDGASSLHFAKIVMILSTHLISIIITSSLYPSFPN